MPDGTVLGEIGEVVLRSMGTRVYYSGTLTSDKLKALTFVPVIEPSVKTYVQESTDEGYQRPGSVSRMRAFRKFLEENRDSVVPPILLSGRGKWQFSSTVQPSFGVLTVSGAAAIIDGQHRAGGYIALYEGNESQPGETRNVDFVLMNDLSREEEIREFVTVNTTQKGVPKPLTEFLLGLELDSDDDTQVAWGLNIADDSPFKGRITRVTMQRHHLFALHSVAKQMGRTFELGAMLDLDVETKIEYAIRYWTIIADKWPEEWADIRFLDDPQSGGRKAFEYKLLELTGLVAWSLIAKLIFSRSYSPTSGMNWENVERLVEIVGTLDWRKEGIYGGRTGEAGGPVIARDMERRLPPENFSPDEH